MFREIFRLPLDENKMPKLITELPFKEAATIFLERLGFFLLVTLISAIIYFGALSLVEPGYSTVSLETVLIIAFMGFIIGLITPLAIVGFIFLKRRIR